MKVGFVLACVLPTIAVAATIAWYQTPWPKDQLEQEIGRRLGAIVEIDQLNPLRPGQFLLTQVCLRDSETRETLANLDCVTVTRAHESVGWTDTTWLVQVDRVNVQTQQLRSLWRVYRDRVLRLSQQDAALQRVVVREVIIENPDATPTTLNSFCWELKNEADQWHHSTMTMNPSPEAGSELSITIQRDRKMSPVETKLFLDTGSQRIPNPLVSAFVGSNVATSSNPWFEMAGELDVTWRAEAWSSRFVGQLYFDVAHLVPNYFPSGTTGDAQLNTDVRFDAQGLQTASALLHVKSPRLPQHYIDQLLKDNVLEEGREYAAMDREFLDLPHLIVRIWLDPQRGLILRGMTANTDDSESIKRYPFPRAIAWNNSGPILLCNISIKVSSVYAALLPHVGRRIEVAQRLQRILPKPLPRE